jgi:hypothetical protein
MQQDSKDTEQKIGDRMADGTIYAGISPDTNQPMFAASVDAPLEITFNQAAKYARNLEVCGQKDFRVPSKAELDVLFRNREHGALKGTFDLTGSEYWSSSPYNDAGGWGQRFSDGAQVCYGRNVDSRVRCVR